MRSLSPVRTQFWIVVAMLLGVTVFLRTRTGAENLPPRRELSGLPLSVGEWQGRQFLIAEDIRKILGEGDFMQRSYKRSNSEPFVELFIAYFPTQRTGNTIHSPKNCLPGSGWVPIESTHIPLQRPDGKAAEVNRYVIQKGNLRQLVIYWYQSHDRMVASEYWAKFYMAADAMRLNRTDGALVRFITIIQPSESVESAQNRIFALESQVLPLLPPFIPR